MEYLVKEDTDSKMEELTPMMQHYMKTKQEYPECLLFYRLGDFYEMFFEDAKTVSKELELTLTGKSCGLKERAPMCGIPYHAVDGYLNKLVNKGYKVAICEQVEDPKLAKGMVKREVVRIATPGTNLDLKSLDETKNNYLMCIAALSEHYGIAVADITTGAFFVTETHSLRALTDEIYQYAPSEIVCNEAFLVSGIDFEELKYQLKLMVNPLESWFFDEDGTTKNLLEHFKVSSLSGLGLEEYPVGKVAAGAMLSYLYETQKNSLSQMTALRAYPTGEYMLLDRSTRRNLELTETLREKQKRGSLLWVLDKTKTAMGARMLRSMMEQPLLNKGQINERLDIVEAFKENAFTREEIREYLNSVYDLERLVSKVSCHSANPRDLVALKTSLSMIPGIRTLMKEITCQLGSTIMEEMDPLEDIFQWIDSTIDEEPPISSKEGGMIKAGADEEIDRLRQAKTEGKSWLADLEAKERERTGIKNLRIKYNKVFGYYLEVTNSYKDLVPEDYMRKQTLTNAERYITPKLKELEDVILGAEEKLIDLEYALFEEVRNKIGEEIVRIQKTARAIAMVDVFASLALVAEQGQYCRPTILQNGTIDIKQGRHPVVEKMIKNEMFISNDTFLNSSNHRISIITGPNMAGKSTYMRQTALIVFMAQIGSFVPASSAKISIVDRIFTRVGASDDLASGQSTFMVEMTEVANILRNSTKNSLLILDEIGRGTSTFDGLSIAWAVVEHICNPKLSGAKTLFATHYHELTELEQKLSGVDNYCIAVKEQGDSIIFLRKIIPGGADKSYGIQVAKLAGVPDSVISRAKQILEELSNADIAGNSQKTAAKLRAAKAPGIIDEVDMQQMSLFDTVKDDDIIKEIKELDIGNLTPIEALNTLYKLQNKVKNRW